jgi:hypothetical protein
VKGSGVELQHVPPRLFGRVPPLGVLAGGALLLLAAVAMLAIGSFVLGPVLLVFAVVLLGLYLVAARHLPPTRVGRHAVSGLWRARDQLRLAGSAARAWSGAGRETLSLQRELRRLGRERDRVQHALGGAAYRGDASSVGELQGRMGELERRMAACAERIVEARREADERVSKARAPLGPTEIRSGR